MDEPIYFRFEQEFVDSLRCVPMVVRLKLDLCGIKLSLRQWSRFTVADRRALARAASETAPEIEAFRIRLISLIAERAGQEPVIIPVETNPLWADVDIVHASVAAQALELGRSAPTLQQWRTLNRLQRFALAKLSRDAHENINFLPALEEFGLDGIVDL